jgi:hypothetical protein
MTQLLATIHKSYIEEREAQNDITRIKKHEQGTDKSYIEEKDAQNDITRIRSMTRGLALVVEEFGLSLEALGLEAYASETRVRIEGTRGTAQKSNS